MRNYNVVNSVERWTVHRTIACEHSIGSVRNTSVRGHPAAWRVRQPPHQQTGFALRQINHMMFRAWSAVQSYTTLCAFRFVAVHNDRVRFCLYDLPLMSLARCDRS
jgi:hypothetical protein